MANTHSTDLELSSSQYWSITDGDQTGLDLSTALTFETWVKFESLATPQVFLSKFTGDNRTYSFDLLNNAIRLVVGEGLQSTDVFTVSWTPSVDTWYHVAVTWTGATKKANFYINGSQQGTEQTGSTVSSIANESNDFFIGARTVDTLNWPLDGLLDDVRVWNDVRTPTEISDNYEKELAGTETGLVGYWRFNNDGDDATSNNNDLTNNNSATFSTDVPLMYEALEPETTYRVRAYATNSAGTSYGDTVEVTTSVALQTYSGSVTASLSANQFSFPKLLMAASISLAGSIKQAIYNTFSGAITLASSFHSNFKTYLGAVTATLSSVEKGLTNVISTVSLSLSASYSKILTLFRLHAVTISLSALYSKVATFLRLHTAEITLSAAISKTLNKVKILSASITLSASYSRIIALFRTHTVIITLSEYLNQHIHIIITGLAISISASYNRLLTLFRNYTATITLTAKNIKEALKAFVTSISLSGTFNSIFILLRTFTGSIGISAGTVKFFIAKRISIAITLVGSIKKYLTKLFENTITLSATAIQSKIARFLGEVSISLFVARVALTKKLLQASITLSDSQNVFFKLLGEVAFILTADVIKLIQSLKIGTINLSVNLTKSIIVKVKELTINLTSGIKQFYYLLAIVTLSLSGLLTKYIILNIKELTITLSDSVKQYIELLLDVTITLSVNLIKSITTKAKNIVISLLGSTGTLFILVVNLALTLSASLKTIFGKVFSVTITLSGGIKQFYYLIASGTLTLAGLISKKTSKVFTGIINISSGIKQFYYLLADVALTLTGKINKSINAIYNATITLAGSIIKSISIIKNATITLTDTSSEYIQLILEVTITLSGKIIRGIVRGATITLSALYAFVKNPIRIIPKIFYFFINKQPKVKSLTINKKPKIYK